MMSLIVSFVWAIVVVIVIAKSTKVAEEGERFAIFVLGQFQEFKGPGVVIVMPLPIG